MPYFKSCTGLVLPEKSASMDWAFFLDLGHKNRQPRFSLSLEDKFSVNFEDELAIINPKYAKIVSIKTASYTAEQHQEHS